MIGFSKNYLHDVIVLLYSGKNKAANIINTWISCDMLYVVQYILWFRIFHFPIGIYIRLKMKTKIHYILRMNYTARIIIINYNHIFLTHMYLYNV